MFVNIVLIPNIERGVVQLTMDGKVPTSLRLI